MTLQTKNLGFVKAIFVGPTAPLNTNAIWRDTSVSPAIHKHYDTSLSQWKSLTQNISTANLTWTSDTTQNLNSKTLTLKDGVVLFNNTTVKIDTLANNDAGTKILVAATDGTIQYRNSSTLIPTAYALTKVDDTNITLTLGGTPASALLAATSITVGWSGTLADGRIASAATWNAKIGGSGTTNTLPKFTGGSTIGNSQITDDGTTVNITASTLRIGGYTTNGFVKTSAGTGLITVSTQVSATEGGTGRSSWTANSLVYIGATNTFGEILAGTNGNVLTMVAGVPSWAALSVSLTSQVTGVLPIANGGTNLSALGSALQYLRVNSGGTALEYATLSVSNLGSANLTSADDARTFTLKTGTTTTQNLAILTGAGGNLTKWMGNGQIDMGSTSYYVQPNIYLNPAATDQFIIYRGSTGLLYLDPLSYDLALIGTSSQRVTIHANSGSIDARSNDCAYNLLTAGGTIRGGLILQSGAAGLYMNNASGTRILNIETQNGYGTIVGSWAVGLSHSTAPSGRLHVKGSGSTSATINALFQNNNASPILTLKDDLSIQEGDSTNFVTHKIYTDPTTNDNVIIYAGTNGWTYWQSQARNYLLYGTTTGVIQLAAQSGKITATGDDGGFRAVNASGVSVGTLETEANGGWFFLANSSGTKKAEFYVGGNQYYFLDGCSFGYAAGSAPLAVVDAKGKGSTSATSTALFKNSTNLTAFEVRDDLAVSMYNNGGYVTNRFFNKGAIIGGNNNGSTTADPNNVLGGSYANGVIIGGYNNTHNGYLGVVSGGSNSVSGEVSFVFSFGSTSTNNYNAILGGASHTASGAYSAVIGGQSNTASGEGAVAVGGNQAIASGYRSFAQGYGSYAQGQYAVTFGSYSTASARSARAVGEFCVASGVSSWASGLGADYGGTTKELKASGVVSFNHSYNDGLVASRAAEGDYSVILGGKNHWTKSGSTSSVILGGEGNTINTNVLRSVILGGSSITATANDTVYGVNFEASTLVTTPQVINTPFTVTVASNAGTITRAYRENKFTNSSASAMTITISTTGALDGDIVRVRIYDFSAAAQTITWVNTENSSVTVPATSNGSTTLPLTVGFQYNSATSKWRCIGSV